MHKAGRIVHSDWNLYDTRHVVYRPARLSPEALEEGYWRAYKNFYRWGNILRGASTKPTLRDGARHVAYSGGWKRLEPMWDWVIRAKRVSHLLPVLENVLAGFGKHLTQKSSAPSSIESALVPEEPSPAPIVPFPTARKR